MRAGRLKAVKRAKDRDEPLPSLGGQVVEWLEHYLPYGPGDVQGLPLRLHDDLKLFVWRAYELRTDHADGVVRRNFSEGVLTAPKGVAKSELQGAICGAEGLGPVVFNGWDAAGNPVGVSRTRARVDIYANSIEQTGNTHLNVAYMLNSSGDEPTARQSLIDDYPGIDIGRSPESSTRIILPDNRGVIRPATGRGRSAEGGIPTTFLAFEETHHMVLPEAHKLYRTVRRQLQKVPAPGAWAMHATNMYGEGEGSVLEAIHKDLALSPDIYWHQRSGNPEVLRPNVDLADVPDETLLAELKSAYGSATYMDLISILAEIRRSSSDDSGSRRLYFNLSGASSGRLVKSHNWRAAERPELVLSAGDTIALGWDGSRKWDASGLVACRLSDRALFVLNVWERPTDAESWGIPVDEVMHTVAAARRTYNVVRFFADPPQWQSEIGIWSNDFGKTTTDDERDIPIVAEWPTASRPRMAAAIERFLTALDESPAKVLHNGDDTLRRHVLNVARKISPFGDLAAKERQTEYIDLFVAAVLAHEAAVTAVEDGCTGHVERKKPGIW
jgi:hypothetical protein